MKKILAAALLVQGLSAIADDAMVFERLSDARTHVTLPELSSEEKTLIVDQAKLVLRDLFVHRDLKIKNWGPEADPIPSLDVTKSRVDSLSTIEFHKEMQKSFRRLHDWHTTYQFPKPYQCYKSLLPAAFKAVKDEFGNEVIAVDSLATNPDFLKLLPPDVKFSVGDVLVNYNGLTPEEAMKKIAGISQGANPAAIKRDSVEFLSLRPHKQQLFPDEDTISITVKDKEGNLKTFDVPWIVKASSDCLKPKKESGNKGAGKDWQHDYNKLFKRKKKTGFKGPGDLLDSKEPILKYKVIRNEFGGYGYLRLDSFVPEKLSVMGTVEEIKRLLEGPLAESEGLIIDLRDNGGGQILLGEATVQLLNPRNTVPLNFTLKNSPANMLLWSVSGPNSPFTDELKKAQAEGRAYTTGIPLNPSVRINSLGQSFMKPVAVFINSSCYSTCDMFTASIQDLGAGIIVGEDANTGAGGANNWQYTDLTDSMPDDNQGPFKDLPKGSNIGFSMRQTFRTGLHAGEVIEDIGVRADMLVPATVRDLDTSEEQLRTITRRLAQEADKFQSWVKMKGSSNIDVKLGQRPKVNLKWNQTSSIEVRVNGNSKGSFDIEPTQIDGRSVEIPDFVSTNSPEISQVEIIGKDQGKRVWRKVVTMRTIPESIVIGKNAPLSQSFEQNYSPLQIYNNGSAAADGWQIKGGELRIGNGSTQYQSNVQSEAILFAKITDATTLSFKASINSEKDYDFLDVNVVDEGGYENTILSISGDELMSERKFDLSKYQGQNIEIRFKFSSDAGVEADGPRIDDLQIK